MNVDSLLEDFLTCFECSSLEYWIALKITKIKLTLKIIKMLSDMSCLNCYFIFSMSKIQPTYVFIGLREGYKWLKFVYIWKGTIWYEKSPPYADVVTSRAFSSTKFMLFIDSVFSCRSVS